MDGFILKKQSVRVVRGEQCRMEVSHKFAALGNLDKTANVNINWENIKVNIKFLARKHLA
jgi:hypothetical protein